MIHFDLTIEIKGDRTIVKELIIYGTFVIRFLLTFPFSFLIICLTGFKFIED